MIVTALCILQGATYLVQEVLQSHELVDEGRRPKLVNVIDAIVEVRTTYYIVI